jgi:hypothetical protein
MNEQDLMQKLVLSKAIMDKSDKIKKGTLPQTSLQEFHTPEARYNIPPEMIGEQTEQPYLSSIPTTKSAGVPTIEAIKKSKLPDEIKKLMMEHPISQPQNPLTSGPTLSDELVEKASRLMGKNSESQISEKSKDIRKGITDNSKLDMLQIKKMIKTAVNEALMENGLIAESTEKSNETFQFRVGSHIFEGKVTKIKKLKD